MARGSSMKNIREPAVAGIFYPENPRELSRILDGFFAGIKKTVDGEVKALIVPHAGYEYSGPVAAWGFAQISPCPHAVIIGPAHFEYIDGIAGNSYDGWQTPLGIVKHIQSNRFATNNHAFDQEHSVEVQLPFLQKTMPTVSLSCFLTGTDGNRKDIAEKMCTEYPNSLFVISSDLSHYLPDTETREKDRKTIHAILNGDAQYILDTQNSACGLEGIALLIEIAQLKKWKSSLVRYDTSAGTSGDCNRVVGYAAIAYYV